MVERLRPFSNALIYVAYTAYIKCRSILDNIFCANEAIHQSKKKLDDQDSSTNGIFLKLLIELILNIWWRYCNVEVFQPNGVDWWKKKIFFSFNVVILLNGEQGTWISCKTGICQGNLLSPYLFILVSCWSFKQAP